MKIQLRPKVPLKGRHVCKVEGEGDNVACLCPALSRGCGWLYC